MERQVSKQKRRLTEEEETVREDYVKKMRDSYPLIIRTLMQDLIVSIDKDGDIVFLNDAAVEFWGKPSEEIIGTHFSNYLYPEDVEKLENNLQEMIKSKHQIKGFISTLKTPRGVKKVAWNAQVVFDDEGNYIGAQATGKDLTEFLRTEEELKWSQTHFRRLFEVLVDPVVIVDMSGKILELSQSAEEILGFPREELVGKQFMETSVVTDKTKALMLKNLERMRNGKYVSPFNVEAVTRDGKKLLYELTPAKLMYKGEPSILGIFHNITEQRKAEERLRASEERFKYFLENAPEAIWVQDVNGTFLDGNKRAEEITGYNREELIGKNMLEINFVPEKYIPKVIEAFKTNQRGEKSGPTDLEIIRKDGCSVFVEASSIPVERDGKFEIIGIARDVTAQKKAEEALRESKKSYSALINAMNDTVWVIGFDGKFIDVNDAAVNVLGYSREELLTMGPCDIDAHLSEEDITGLIKQLPDEGIQLFETVHFTKDGKAIPVEISSSLVTYKGKQAILSIARDITERKKAQEAIKETNQRLKRSNEELESYTYAVSHDLKAPLRTIKSFGSFLLEDYKNKLDETGQDYLNRMIKASSHMDAMIEDLLVLSRVGRQFTEIEKVDLNKLLKEILADLEATIKERNAKVIVDKLPTLYVHRVWKRQLFMNLISNALKFNESEPPMIEVLYEERENEHLFKVRDNGIGIEEKYLDRIFNLFERAHTEKKYEGTGAGLAICKKIVEHLGGKIWVESTLGEGSTFFFTIPKERKQKKEK